ncbi:MAG: PaaI family thioesterase [Candidatus Omnitrophica bacterium]|nr:PaaI family thioesterase [Candidatus Omnitrophota bacterium]
MEIRQLKAPFEKYLNIVIIEAKDGYARVKMPFKRKFANPYGSFHGGVIASLADTAMAVAVVSKYPNIRFYTVRLEIKFKSSTDKGNIVAEAKLLSRKKDFVFAEAKIKSNVDKLLARVLATFYLAKS